MRNIFIGGTKQEPRVQPYRFLDKIFQRVDQTFFPDAVRKCNYLADQRVETYMAKVFSTWTDLKNVYTTEDYRSRVNWWKNLDSVRISIE